MSVRPILAWPDARLRRPADPVEAVTDEIRAIWDDMVDTMRAMPGVGLAAPQIGVMLRLAVVDAASGQAPPIRLANPEIVEASAEMRVHDEASPCLPGVSARLKRPRQVSVRFLDPGGASVTRDFEGLAATSVQHQIDHLDGKLYFDRLSRMKRDMLLKRAQKLAEA
jgi:peptide deformylase